MASQKINIPDHKYWIFEFFLKRHGEWNELKIANSFVIVKF